MEIREIQAAFRGVLSELFETAKLRAGCIVVIGCSSSEIAGERIGTSSSPEIGAAVYETAAEVLGGANLYIAAQCCEHLNRALVMERAAAERYNLEIVNAVPRPKAGGSFAAAAYERMDAPVLTAGVLADAGIDIGGTLIGMHLRRIAVPVKLKTRFIGGAYVTAARTRPAFTGGSRAEYDETLF